MNLKDHMVAQRFNYLNGICVGIQPRAERICYFVEKVVIYHGKTRKLHGTILQIMHGHLNA